MPMFLNAVPTSADVLDSTVVSFVVDSVKDILGIFTTAPLGIFLTLGVVGSVTGLALYIVHGIKHA